MMKAFWRSCPACDMAELVYIGVLFFLLLAPIQLHIMLIHPLKTSFHRGSLQLLEPFATQAFCRYTADSPNTGHSSLGVDMLKYVRSGNSK